MERSLVYFVKGKLNACSFNSAHPVEELEGEDKGRTGFAWVERSEGSTKFQLVKFLDSSLTLREFDTLKGLVFDPVKDVDTYLWIVKAAAILLTVQKDLGRIEIDLPDDTDEGCLQLILASNFYMCRAVRDFWRLERLLTEEVRDARRAFGNVQWVLRHMSTSNIECLDIKDLSDEAISDLMSCVLKRTKTSSPDNQVCYQLSIELLQVCRDIIALYC